jgi:hypothetical protein
MFLSDLVDSERERREPVGLESGACIALLETAHEIKEYVKKLSCLAASCY